MRSGCQPDVRLPVFVQNISILAICMQRTQHDCTCQYNLAIKKAETPEGVRIHLCVTSRHFYFCVSATASKRNILYLYIYELYALRFSKQV